MSGTLSEAEFNRYLGYDRSKPQSLYNVGARDRNAIPNFEQGKMGRYIMPPRPNYHFLMAHATEELPTETEFDAAYDSMQERSAKYARRVYGTPMNYEARGPLMDAFDRLLFQNAVRLQRAFKAMATNEELPELPMDVRLNIIDKLFAPLPAFPPEPSLPE